MNKKRFDEKYVTGKLVRCFTQADAIKFLALAESFGYKWKIGHKFSQRDNWEVFKEDTCYNISDGSYANVGYFRTHWKHMEIVEFRGKKRSKSPLTLNVYEEDMPKEFEEFGMSNIKVYNNKTLIVYFQDGQKIVETARSGDKFDLRVGMGLVIVHRLMSKGKFNKAVRELEYSPFTKTEKDLFAEKYVTGKVVNCKTKEDALKLLLQADRLGYKWIFGNRYDDASICRHWDLYKEDFCISINSGTYQNRDYYDCFYPQYKIVTYKQEG